MVVHTQGQDGGDSDLSGSVNMVARYAILGAIGATVACSLQDPGQLNVGSAPSSDTSSLDSSASDISGSSSDVDAQSDARPTISFTFVDGAQDWTFEGAYPVGADNIVETWVSPTGDTSTVSDSASDAQVETGIDANIDGPALVYTFDCPPPDTYDVGDATEDGAGVNILFKGNSTQIAPYAGKTMHFVASFTGHLVLYQFFAQDLDTNGYGVGPWTSLGLAAINSSGSLGVVNALSQPFPGLQDGGDVGAKFGIQLSCGANSGPVTVAVTSIMFE
jgi:hypothetical protein